MIFVNKSRQYNPAVCSDGLATTDTNKVFKYINNCSPNTISGCSEQFTSKNTQTGIKDILKSISGQYPALLNWEIYTQQTASANKTKMLSDINAHISQGGVVGLHDHPGNPVTYSLFDTAGYADRSGSPVAAIKSGGSKNADYLAYLDEVATIISSINGPVLYRPFHEINGNWFWWNGSDRRADMILVWQQTVDYLRNTKGLHNILFVLNFDANGELGDSNYGSQALSTWWPGSNYVDIISIDYYPSSTPETLDSARFNSAYSELLSLAATYQKPVGISEYGAQNLVAQTQENFWSDFGFYLKNKFKEFRFFCTWNGTYAPAINAPSSDGYRQTIWDNTVIGLDEFYLDKP